MVAAQRLAADGHRSPACDVAVALGPGMERSDAGRDVAGLQRRGDVLTQFGWDVAGRVPVVTRVTQILGHGGYFGSCDVNLPWRAQLLKQIPQTALARTTGSWFVLVAGRAVSRSSGPALTLTVAPALHRSQRQRLQTLDHKLFPLGPQPRWVGQHLRQLVGCGLVVVAVDLLGDAVDRGGGTPRQPGTHRVGQLSTFRDQPGEQRPGRSGVAATVADGLGEPCDGGRRPPVDGGTQPQLIGLAGTCGAGQCPDGLGLPDPCECLAHRVDDRVRDQSAQGRRTAVHHQRVDVPRRVFEGPVFGPLSWPGAVDQFRVGCVGL